MKKLDTRLWNVTGGENENITVSHIEAKTAKEALSHFFEDLISLKTRKQLKLSHGRSMKLDLILNMVKKSPTRSLTS